MSTDETLLENMSKGERILNILCINFVVYM